jgi:hypothetical protein
VARCSAYAGLAIEGSDTAASCAVSKLGGSNSVKRTGGTGKARRDDRIIVIVKGAIAEPKIPWCIIVPTSNPTMP